MSFQSKLRLNVMLVTENLWLTKYCQNIYISTRRARVCGRYIFNSQQSISFSFRWIFHIMGCVGGNIFLAVQSQDKRSRTRQF